MKSAATTLSLWQNKTTAHWIYILSVSTVLKGSQWGSLGEHHCSPAAVSACQSHMTHTNRLEKHLLLSLPPVVLKLNKVKVITEATEKRHKVIPYTESCLWEKRAFTRLGFQREFKKDPSSFCIKCPWLITQWTLLWLLQIQDNPFSLTNTTLLVPRGQLGKSSLVATTKTTH